MVEVETIVLCAVAFLFKMAIEWRVQSVGIKRFIFFFFFIYSVLGRFSTNFHIKMGRVRNKRKMIK